MDSQCIFTGKLLAMADGLPIPLDYADAKKTAIWVYERLEPIDRYFPRYYEVGGLSSVLSSAMYESAPPHFSPHDWYWQLVIALRDHARQLDNAVSNGAYYAHLLSDTVSTVQPRSWLEYLAEIPVVVEDGKGVALHCSEYSNCGYVVINGFVFKAYGFHMYNLYNRFAASRYNWNGIE